ncbi:nucleotidyltransferase [Bacillus arachidis]|uniref:Nucleotidyltransferase n=1 Tax=Bacillus arachidis TaxID=2819290 RepID=A0ABS3P4Y8_9BACI|nr:nucleotidyltransferase [Bacillus arachidis]MBO1628258.1 nucleotidyltransferase [Bacillus arachidis]
MVKTTNSAYDNFIKDSVDLDSKQTGIARNSRDWLYGNLKSFPTDVENFPQLYAGKEIIGFGSFRRKTKIRPLDDIDLMLVFKAVGTTYTEYTDKIVLNVPESADKLRKLVNDDGTLNSIRVIEKIKSSLSIIPQYKKAEIHRRQEAATLELSTYDWVFDIVPAFITSEDAYGKSYYIIPDGSGNWKKTDPRIDNERVTETNKKFDGNVLGLIRVVKYWNTNCSKTISSYLMENIVLDYFQYKLYWNGMKQELKGFFEYLKTSIYSSHYDPKGIQGDLNTLDYNTQLAISNQASECFENIDLAIRNEILGKHEEAIEYWKKVFSDEFPSYED